MLLSELAARIRAQREKRGLKQTDVAHAMQISPQAVSKWERGENAPDISVLPALAKLLDVSVDWLLGVNAEERDVFKASVLATGVRGARRKSAHLSPKDFAAWSNAFSFQATEAVLRYDGVPVKSMGPGILAFFSGQNHERRAIEAALTFRQVCDEPIKAAASSGLIYLGSMGHPAYAHPDIMGEAVSIALLAVDWASGHTESGVVAAAATAKAGGRVASLGPIQTVQLEGIGHPVEIVEILAKK
ncbi:helix-turn-helix domain-containing protein [bacterium]|nr:helix-turn-helix domain-containing protein [bacterium]